MDAIERMIMEDCPLFWEAVEKAEAKKNAAGEADKPKGIRADARRDIKDMTPEQVLRGAFPDAFLK